jgi:hypothetical protein
MDELFQLLAIELEKLRVLPPQVGRHLTATYGIGRDEIGAFVANELSKLEEYEIDLILSPVFTPSILEQAVVAEFLGREAVPPATISALINRLLARPTVARLAAEDGEEHGVVLQEVSVARYVNRLRLEGSIPESLFDWIACAAVADQPLLKALARRSVWELPGRREILERFLEFSLKSPGSFRADSVALLRLMEIYQPADRDELASRVPQWVDGLNRDLNVGSAPKPFFNERVEELHGGGRDQRRGDSAGLALKQEELAFLERLRAIFPAAN